MGLNVLGRAGNLNMRWKGGRRSSNIEDRRGRGGTPKVPRRRPGHYRGAIDRDVFRGRSNTVAGDCSISGPVSSTGTQPTAEDLENDPLADMVSVVVADTEVSARRGAASRRCSGASTASMSASATMCEPHRQHPRARARCAGRRSRALAAEEAGRHGLPAAEPAPALGP